MKHPLLAAALLLLPSALGASEWRAYGQLAIPQHQYTFLASTPRGDLIATTFHNREAGSPAMEIPAFLVRDPISYSPQVQELCRVEFPNQRGYSGVASDPSGAFFISGDTGDRATSFLRRFTAEGVPDPAFAQGGEMRPGRRCLGLDVLGDYLMVAVDWGEILVLSARDGTRLGSIEPREIKPFIRDVAIDPKSLDIHGVAQGALYRWSGGTPWNLRGYKLEQVSQPMGELRSDEGLSFDPFARMAVVAPIPGNVLLEISEKGDTRRTTVGSATATAHLADSVLSFDGSVLFLSDKVGRRIHVLKRTVAGQEGEAATAAAAGGPASAHTTAQSTHGVAWVPSYATAVEKARREGKPMVVYFRSPTVERCLAFEREVLLTAEFAAAAAGHVCVFEDTTKDRLMAYRFGVHRVPSLVVLDPEGGTRAEFTWAIAKDSVLEALQ